MATKEDYSNLHRDRQSSPTEEAAHEAQIEGRLKEVHTCIPGIVSSFDAAKQTAEVQPAIKRIWTEKGPIALPLCVDVPVQFAGGGGFFLTFPVKAGDECVLYFSERAIDFWFVSGGVQLPAEYRLHDLSDAFALVGVNSLPNVIPNFQTDATELRTRDRATRITIKDDGTIENVNAGGSTELTPAGKFTINAPGGIVLNGMTQVIGDISGTAGNGGTGEAAFDGDVVGQGTSLHTHVHTNGGGTGNSGQPA